MITENGGANVGAFTMPAGSGVFPFALP